MEGIYEMDVYAVVYAVVVAFVIVGNIALFIWICFITRAHRRLLSIPPVTTPIVLVSRDVAKRILERLGLQEKGVRRLTLRMEAQNPPTLDIERFAEAGETEDVMALIADSYELVLKPTCTAPGEPTPEQVANAPPPPPPPPPKK